MSVGNCIRCKSSLNLQDEFELAPVKTKNGDICARCYRDMSDNEIKAYLGKS